MKNKIIFTSKDHANAAYEIFPSLASRKAETLQISKEPVNHYCKFGVAITPSSCYELSLMDAEERTALLEHLYGKNGIGLSIGRLCIASSDYSPEIYSYDDVAFDTELKHFSVERDERYVIPMIQEILKINPDLFLYAAPWSPPFWMKTSENMCGGYMRDAFLDCYADYFVKFIQAYAEHGIKISAVTPQNEPETQQAGSMPACIWHPEIEAAFINILRRKLDANHLDVQIWMHDHGFDGVNRIMWSLNNTEGLRESCNGFAFHYYDGTIEQTGILKEKYPELDLHFTEGGPRLVDNYETDWCKWGIMMVKALKTGYKTFAGWNLMLNELGGPNVGPFHGICGGFVTQDHRTNSLIYSGQYKAFSHIVPYILPSSKIYGISMSDSFNMTMSYYPRRDHEIEGVVIDNDTDELVAVLINPNDHSMAVQLDLGGKNWYIELQAESISTVIVNKL